MFSFLIAYITVSMLPYMLSMKSKQSKYCLSLIIFYGVLCFLNYRSMFVYNITALLFLLFTYIVLLFISWRNPLTEHLNHKNQIVKTYLAILLVVSFNLVINATYLFEPNKGNYTNSFTNSSTALERIYDSKVDSYGYFQLKSRDGREFIVEKDQGSILLHFNSLENSELYMRLLNFQNNTDHNLNITITNGIGVEKPMYSLSSFDIFNFGRTNYAANLGYTEVPQTTCLITFSKKGIYSLDGIQIFSQPMENYIEHVSALSADVLEEVQILNNQIKGEIVLKEKKHEYCNWFL